MSRQLMFMMLLTPMLVAWQPAPAPALEDAKLLLSEVKAINKLFAASDCDALVIKMKTYDGAIYREAAYKVERQYTIHETDPEFGEPPVITQLREATAETGRVVSLAGKRCESNPDFRPSLMRLMAQLDYRTPKRAGHTLRRKNPERRASDIVTNMRNKLLAYTVKSGAPPADLDAAKHVFRDRTKQRWPEKDPWGHPYRYELSDNGREFQVFSIGPDGVAHTDDDIYPRPDVNAPPKHASHGEYKLTKADVLKGVNKHMGKLLACGRDAKVKDKVLVKFRINQDGTTSKINILSAKYGGTQVGVCIERVIKNMRFPAHNKPDMMITYPVRLR